MSYPTKYSTMTIGEIVASDFRAAEIFKNAGIDFCCGGKKNLDMVFPGKSKEATLLLKQLKELDNIPSTQIQNYNDWEIGFLADYIVNNHHRYVVKALPELVFYTQKIASVHGSNHPELIEVANLFEQINMELLKHLKQEEEVLFPAIKEMIKCQSLLSKEIITSEINRMRSEHEFAGNTMDKICKWTSHYQVPEDGCNTYKVALNFLKQFEDDLHVHVHLENNILYPKALSL